MASETFPKLVQTIKGRAETRRRMEKWQASDMFIQQLFFYKLSLQKRKRKKNICVSEFKRDYREKKKKRKKKSHVHAETINNESSMEMNIQQLTFRGINTTCCYWLSPVPAVTEVCSADNPAPRSLQSKQENQVGMEMSMSPFAWSVCSPAPSCQDALLPPCLRSRIYISTCKLSCQMRMNKY